MTSRLGHDEFARLDGRIRAAWVRLNQAGDTPDAHRSILGLQAAWEDVQAVAETLAAGTTPEAILARHHQSLRRAAPDARGILESLSARAAALQRVALDAVGEKLPWQMYRRSGLRRVIARRPHAGPGVSR